MRFLRTVLTVFVLVVLTTGVSAQKLASPSSQRAKTSIATATSVQALSKLQLDRPDRAQQQRQVRIGRRSPGRIIAGAAVGATAGFFAGGYLGAVIDGDCGGCDDPGFTGFLIGAPVGAAVGGILGGKFFF